MGLVSGPASPIYASISSPLPLYAPLYAYAIIGLRRPKAPFVSTAKPFCCENQPIMLLFALLTIGVGDAGYAPLPRLVHKLVDFIMKFLLLRAVWFGSLAKAVMPFGRPSVKSTMTFSLVESSGFVTASARKAIYERYSASAVPVLDPDFSSAINFGMFVANLKSLPGAVNCV